MAKKGTLGYKLGQLRKTAERRMSRLTETIQNKSLPVSVRSWAKETKRKMAGAIQRTKTVNKQGKRQAWKTEAYREKAGQELEQLVKDVPSLYNPAGTSDYVTTQQLNLASSKRTEAASIYSFEEKSIFYRVTQKIWQQKGISDKERNEAIIEYFNRERGNKPPLSLSEIVDKVLEQNKKIKEAQKLNPLEKLTQEQRELYQKYGAIDNADSESKSPSGIGQVVVDAIFDALDEILDLPDFDEALYDEFGDEFESYF